MSGIRLPLLGDVTKLTDLSWINPIGGLGDMLMLSGVLKLVIDHTPTRRFNLLRRSGYDQILGGHPAIAHIGFMPKGSLVQRVDYWSMEQLGPDAQRPYQILARGFGLETPVVERLWVPGEIPDDPLLHAYLPEDKPIALIAPASDSPRKMMRPERWHDVVQGLLDGGFFVAQIGRGNDRHIRNAYSMLGLTTVRQALALLERCAVVVTVDNFVMHAAHYVGVPAVVVWGPTDHRVYGYDEQLHLQMPKACGLAPGDDCFAPSRGGGRVYGTTCPHGTEHCVDQVDAIAIVRAARDLARAAPKDAG